MKNQPLEFVETPLEQHSVEQAALVMRVALIRIKQNDECCNDIPKMMEELFQSVRANPKSDLQDLLCK